MHVDVDKSKTTLVIFIHYMKLLDAIWILSFHNTRPSRSVVGCYCCCLPRNKVEQFRHRRRDMLSGSAVVVLALTTETLPSRNAVGLRHCCFGKVSNAPQLQFRHRRRDMLSGSAVVVLALTTETLPSRNAVGLCRCCSCKISNASQLDHES